jgi:serine/threonine protein kinase
MAELYLARDPQTGSLRVIKRILPYLSGEPEFVQMFLDEARIAAQLHHPNIIEVFELGRIDESIFIAMEFVDGVDLRKLLGEELKRGKAVPHGIAAWVAAQICDGLHYAHNRVGLDGQPMQIIHRDISPQNVMVAFDGAVKLVDFGIAKAGSVVERSKPGVIKGKFLYLSPEQLSAEIIDHRADLFAIGTMLYEVTTGKSPFHKLTTEAVILAVRNEDPPPPHLTDPAYPRELSRIVMRCLSKDRTRRYQQADEIAHDLRAFLAALRRPTTLAEVALYTSELLGDEGERTTLHIPGLVSNPPTDLRLGGRRDQVATRPLPSASAPRALRPSTSERLPPPVMDLPEPPTLMARPKAEKPRGPTPASPARRPSRPHRARSTEGTDETAGSLTPSTGADRPALRAAARRSPPPSSLEEEDVSLTGDPGTVTAAPPPKLSSRRLLLVAAIVTALLVLVTLGARWGGASEAKAPGEPSQVAPPQAVSIEVSPPRIEGESTEQAQEEPEAAAEAQTEAEAEAPAEAEAQAEVAAEPVPLPPPEPVPVIFKAPKGTTIQAGKQKFIPERTYRLEPGPLKATYRCSNGQRGTATFNLEAGAQRTRALSISCRRK